ncbi:uncharacterized protein [Triticum aestivum]|uniref:uncharacterized protein isoform X2 n=1 Tax=Triticum aestivum TaxID=4565 RepID=UPI000DF56B71|nr:uncharacterized protein LOC123083357 isoform X2 [Triticum aestivum]
MGDPGGEPQLIAPSGTLPEGEKAMIDGYHRYGCSYPDLTVREVGSTMRTSNECNAIPRYHHYGCSYPLLTGWEAELTMRTSNESNAIPRASPPQQHSLKHWCHLGFRNFSFAAFIGIIATIFSWMCPLIPPYGKTPTGKQRYYADSASTIHATGNRSLISNLTTEKAGALIMTANVHSPLRSHGCGHVSSDDIVLPEVHYVPGLGINVVSVSKLAELDYMLMFVHKGCSIFDTRSNDLVGKGRAVSGLFELDYLRVPLDRAQA